MGENRIIGLSKARLRPYTEELLRDVRALERMHAEDLFERGVRRIGAEQEMFLVDDVMRPACVAIEVLERADDARLTTELASFNLEANLSPRVFGPTCLSAMHAELEELLGKVRRAAAPLGASVLLAGTLPTLRKSDLGLDNMTPKERYFALNSATCEQRGGDFHVRIMGLDELAMAHDNVMLESCNTSLQLHWQAEPSEFARLYNAAQVISAPLLAAAVNSPLLLGRRLWPETRVALFHQSVDARSATPSRELRPRVSFGERWVRESAVELFRENIAWFRPLADIDAEEDPFDALAAGRAPRLFALCLHNGTIYRWNRPCYGITDGAAHLRIENRVLPAGPTTVDAMANAAFFFGLMNSLDDAYGDVTARMAFDDAKENFLAAARNGLKAQFTWIDGHTRVATRLIADELLPMARRGLAAGGIEQGDIDRYLGVLEERVAAERTGARWVLQSLTEMNGGGTPEQRGRTVVEAMLENQRRSEPVHRWPLCRLPDGGAAERGPRTVAQIMSTDLFTVRRDDVVDLAASLMDWEHIRHLPVEDEQGGLVGLVSYRSLVRLVASERRNHVPVSSIMTADPLTISPDAPILDAMRLMRDGRVSALPVVREGKLVGIVSERDLIAVSQKLLERHLSEGVPAGGSHGE